MTVKLSTYTVFAKRQGDQLPIEFAYCDKKEELLVHAATMQTTWPTATIYAIRNAGLTQGKPIRWQFKGGAMEEVAWYDKTKGTIPMEEEWKAIGFVPIVTSRSK